MTPTHARAIAVTVVALTLAVGAAGLAAAGVEHVPTQVWNACRTANRWTSYVVALLVFLRLGDMAFDPARWRDPRARHLMLWFAWIGIGLIIAAAGAAHYEAIDAPANWTSGARSGLLAAAIVLSLWWPHPRHFTPIEEAPRGPVA